MSNLPWPLMRKIGAHRGMFMTEGATLIMDSGREGGSRVLALGTSGAGGQGKVHVTRGPCPGCSLSPLRNVHIPVFIHSLCRDFLTTDCVQGAYSKTWRSVPW